MDASRQILIWLLERYVLWAIGRLDAEDEAKLEVACPKLRNLFHAEGRWQEVLRAAMQWDTDPAAEIIMIWKKNEERARQLLKERGVEVSETDIRDASNFSPEMGTDAPSLARAMNKYEPDSGTQWVAKPVYPDELEQQSYPYIAFMRGSYGPAHAVIVDKTTPKQVRIRDPWGPQAEASPESPGPGIGYEAKMDRSEYIWVTRPAHFWTVTRTSRGAGGSSEGGSQ